LLFPEDPMPPHPAIASTAEIVTELKAGRMVILVDEEDRENEGDLVMAAEHITPEAINFMARFGRGLICLTLTEARCKKLGLSQMARNNKTQYGTAFTVSIEAAEGVTTGISAADRARTIQVAVAKNTTIDDIVQPGHVFPITAREGGVLVRAGHTEAGCDLAGMAGLEPSSVICEIMNDDGTMARLPELIEFAREHSLKIGTIADLIHYRAASETLVERVTSKPVQTAHGEFTLHAFVDRASGATHLALVKGQIPVGGETLVRVHEPLSVLDFLDPASKQQSFSIDQAQAALAKHGHGVIVLMHRPEDGEALLSRLTGQSNVNAPRVQQKWDPRTYGIGAQILRDLGVSQMRLLSSPRKMPSMTGFGLEVTGFVTSPAEL
jgi:3,4-dihydroxy 2-butanone 4-phosphate synthase/GTP cyclohydrolase II